MAKVKMKGYYWRNKKTGEKYYDGARTGVTYKRTIRGKKAKNLGTTRGAKYHPRLYNQPNFKRRS